MVFQPTPPRNNAPSQLLSLASILNNSSGSTSDVTITLAALPATISVGAAISVSGTISPSGTAVVVGLSTSADVKPSTWISGTVSATLWTASIAATTVGTFYVWAAESANSAVAVVSSAIDVLAAATVGEALSYSLISGSGNGSLAGISLSTAANYAIDWTSEIAVGATDVRPDVTPSSLGNISGCKFWFDTSASNIAIPTSGLGNAGSFNNNNITFYPYSAGYGLPTTAPGAPASAGQYFGKYAMYDSNSNLLGVFVTSTITVS